ncbi:hypothetical protein MWU53_15805 [Aliiroseovarius sp. S1123]|nr:hypothetical protein [Aliiroseovarius sp. S1123]
MVFHTHASTQSSILYGSAKGSELLLFRAINPDDKRPIQALRGMLWLRKIELGAGQNEG